MTRLPGRDSTGTLYFSRKGGKITECTLGSGFGCTVPLEAGEFFYDLEAVFAPVRCHRCDSFQIAYFSKATCMANDDMLSDYEDHMDFASDFECADCGTSISLNLFATWYNNVVNFYKHNVENCRLISVRNTDRIFSSLRKGSARPVAPPQ